jgi:hypothetical protein
MTITRTCTFEDCTKPHVCHGLCDTHRKRLARTGTPSPKVPQTPEQRRERKREDNRARYGDQRHAHQAAMTNIRTALGCAECGTRTWLVFHHVDGGVTKLFDIADGWMHSKAELAAELRKCEVLCRLHHARAHKALPAAVPALDLAA